MHVIHDASAAMLSPKLLAERWDTSVGTLANLRCKGVGPAYVKLSPGKVLYPLELVEQYEAERLVSAVAS